MVGNSGACLIGETQFTFELLLLLGTPVREREGEFCAKGGFPPSLGGRLVGVLAGERDVQAQHPDPEPEEAALECSQLLLAGFQNVLDLLLTIFRLLEDALVDESHPVGAALVVVEESKQN